MVIYNKVQSTIKKICLNAWKFRTNDFFSEYKTKMMAWLPSRHRSLTFINKLRFWFGKIICGMFVELGRENASDQVLYKTGITARNRGKSRGQRTERGKRGCKALLSGRVPGRAGRFLARDFRSEKWS